MTTAELAEELAAVRCVLTIELSGGRWRGRLRLLRLIVWEVESDGLDKLLGRLERDLVAGMISIPEGALAE